MISSRPQQEYIIADEGYVVTDEETLRMVGDPLQLRILATLTKEPRSVKQVAETLSVSPARLNHHFSVLEQKALISLSSTVNGEKRYQSAARFFQTGPVITPTATTLSETRHLPLSATQAEELAARLYEVLATCSATTTLTPVEENIQWYTISLTMRPVEGEV